MWFTLLSWTLVAWGQIALSNSITLGDRAFEKRNDKQELQAALDHYKKSMLDSRLFVEASWKYSMALQSFASRFVDDESTQIEIFKEGAETAKQASEQDPQCGPCEFWTAINLAQYGERKGVFKMLGSLSEIISRLEKAAALDPNHAMAGPYRVLGTIYQTLPGIVGGDDQKAQSYFEKAISLNPGEPINYLAIAKFKTEQGDRDLAKVYAQKGLNFTNDPHISLESRESYRELVRLSQGPP